ncbi:MAG: hypothetical protein IJ563_01470 [Selenomonadaceae bacterium]|nr:hypothetical protein [Selenomonadaceae bacterium]MBR1858313.1 hypothetical protein [Selenomonadaceae bacterium]
MEGETLNIKLELLLRSVDVASYIPGRIRLRSKKLVGNLKLEREIKSQLGSFNEIDTVETSTTTGSILITYVPDNLRSNKDLARAEKYIAKHAKK